MKLPSKHFFGWFFLVDGFVLLIYMVFPFWPTVTWELQSWNRRVEIKAQKLAFSKVLANPVVQEEFVASHLPENRDVNKKGNEIQQQPIKIVQTVFKEPVQSTSPQTHSPVKTIQQKIIKIAQAKTIEKTIPPDNRIIIPSIKLNALVVEGDEKALQKGVWLLPKTAYPGNGNAVLSAHRTKEFYHLNKLKVGDEITVYWQGKEYQYRVKKNFTVKPNDIEILNKTSNSQLTLFTCEPLISMAKRIVVIAEQI